MKAIPFSGGWAHGKTLPRIGSFYILGAFKLKAAVLGAAAAVARQGNGGAK
jgi:hypothetical protein